ncbi:FAD-binding oxidoreductase (plasmid) [Rhodococcus pseudokoreensis]|uniref:FAD-binding oxidoreductase n=1 Tax=Rhodococcus pseudokoreensis TaxID=2811421 RepID=A0A974VY40_9NOCA|nr:FAD-dependent oxidoreductase [Rhodococcus pseudokoreensis]QSE87332.1 FAD-binding oxidoreductase [Rhodococcus pseudokoreensis]
MSSAVSPRTAVVVGAGVAGLSTAWFLLQEGVEVTVVDRGHVGAGASWGNAGWLSPALAVPLPEPSALRVGLKAFSSTSPVRVPLPVDPTLARFLARFARNCTHRRWQVALQALSVLNRQALDAYDDLAQGGVADTMWRQDPVLIAFADEDQREQMLTEIGHLGSSGMPVDLDVLDGDATRDRELTLSDRIRAGILLRGQRSIDPPRFLASLYKAVVEAGGRVLEGDAVTGISDTGGDVRVDLADGTTLRTDTVVLAAGGWISPLARKFGVRTPVQAGRGYSFSMPAEGLPTTPTYLPSQKVVFTPLDGRVRVSGIMEFADPERPLDRKSIETIIAAATPILGDVDWSRRRDEWVGSRPCTVDGLPLVGRTESQRVFICGGHGMWGIAHGPLTGKLLTQQIISGRPPAELAALSPLR